MVVADGILSTEISFFLGAFPVALVGLTLFQWKQRHNFLKIDHQVIPRYEAPEGLLPAGIGTLRDNHLDERDIVAGIVFLATQGYLTITEKNIGGRDYILAQTEKSWPQEAVSFDRRLLHSIFGEDYSDDLKSEVLFSELAGKFHRALPFLQVTVEGQLRDAGFFRNREVSLSFEKCLASLSIVAGVVAQFISSVEIVFLGWLFLVGGLASWGLLATFPGRKTLRGAEVAYEIKCYREYLLTAEIDRVEWQEQQYLYEKHLPYAIALDVADIWSERFEGFAAIPSWFTGTRKMRLQYMGSQLNKLLSWVLSPKDPWWDDGW